MNKQRGGQYKRDQVTVTEANLLYNMEKPGNGQRVTLELVARKFGIKAYDLANHRRNLSPDVQSTNAHDEKTKIEKSDL